MIRNEIMIKSSKKKKKKNSENGELFVMAGEYFK